jgi:hypothetical protein
MNIKPHSVNALTFTYEMSVGTKGRGRGRKEGDVVEN